MRAWNAPDQAIDPSPEPVQSRRPRPPAPRVATRRFTAGAEGRRCARCPIVDDGLSNSASDGPSASSTRRTCSRLASASTTVMIGTSPATIRVTPSTFDGCGSSRPRSPRWPHGGEPISDDGCARISAGNDETPRTRNSTVPSSSTGAVATSASAAPGRGSCAFNRPSAQRLAKSVSARSPRLPWTWDAPLSASWDERFGRGPRRSTPGR